jgi:predicted MFS family arabinose efflux permease
MTQLGYAAGLLFLVPLSDLIENRRLLLSILTVDVIGLVFGAFAGRASLFFTAAILIGVGSVAAQVLVPLASHLAPEEQRGKVVGNVMSGLLLGIMLARPAASLIAGIWNWQMVFRLSAIIMAILAVILVRILPRRFPRSSEGYGTIMISMGALLLKTSVLRRRALYQAALFGSFSLFWTVVPLWLSQHFHLSQKEIAIFAFAGVAGAIAAPIAGRLADRGLSGKLNGFAFLAAVLSFGVTHILESKLAVSLMIFCFAAILLDMAVSGNLVLSQQVIYGLGDEIRGRVNGIFMAVFFVGGAIGSALGGLSYSLGGWTAASMIGMGMPAAAFLYYLTEKRENEDTLV